MGRPNYNRMQKANRFIGEFLGETAVWRQFVSASVGTPYAGRGNEPSYQDRTITGLFVPVSFNEIAQAGGYYEAGDMKATLLDALPNGRDEVRWRGVMYRVESDPVPTYGFSGWTMVLRRGGRVSGA